MWSFSLSILFVCLSLSLVPCVSFSFFLSFFSKVRQRVCVCVSVCPSVYIRVYVSAALSLWLSFCCFSAVVCYYLVVVLVGLCIFTCISLADPHLISSLPLALSLSLSISSLIVCPPAYDRWPIL